MEYFPVKAAKVFSNALYKISGYILAWRTGIVRLIKPKGIVVSTAGFRNVFKKAWF